MQVITSEIDPYTLDVRVVLDRNDLARYAGQVTNELSSEIKMPGFRKGKAPKRAADLQLDPAFVRQEILNRAISVGFAEAIEREKWDVMRASEPRIIKSDSDGMEYSLQVALWPIVKLPDLSTITVSREEVVVGDIEVAEALDTALNMRATFLDKTGPAANGDRVEVDFDVSINGEPIHGGQSRNHPMVIGGRNFMPGFEDELVGLSADQTKKFSLIAPSDYCDPRLAGKKLDFTVTVRRVQTVLKPIANDDFARSVGKFENMAQFTENLRAGIVQSKNVNESHRTRLAALDAIIAQGTIPAPQALVAAELDATAKRFTDDLRSRGVELTMHLAHLNKTEDQLRVQWRDEAERQVRIMLTLRQIAKDCRVAVSPEEVEEEAERVVGELMRSGQFTEDRIDPERIREALAERLLTEKTLSLIERTCVHAGNLS